MTKPSSDPAMMATKDIFSVSQKPFSKKGSTTPAVER